jgi:chemotaxis methyl-accepting protein methylase
MKSDYLFFEGIAAPANRPVAVPHSFIAHDSCDEIAASVHAFFETLLDQVQLRRTAYRCKALERRLAACLRFLRVATPDEARRKLEQQPHLASATVSVALLGVTDFFRDRMVFDRINEYVLPLLSAQYERLRIWSAACSDGPELYSVAMLLAERRQLERCELVGTDCREDAIAAARTGRYSLERAMRIDARWRDRFMNRTADEADVMEPLRRAMQWKVADIFGEPESGPWHLILWRNMAIYLEPIVAETVWKKLCDELAPGGFLITGKADYAPQGLPLVRVSNCVYRKHGR